MNHLVGPPARRFGGAALRPLLAALALAVLLGAGAAQRLPALLPADTAVALGLVDVQSQQARLQPFLDEAERLGLVGRLQAALPSDADDALDDGAAAVPDALSELGVLDLLGREAWLTVTASPFNPLPSLTLIARPTEAGRDAFAQAIDGAAERPGTERMREGQATFYTFVPDTGSAGDVPEVPLAYAQADEVLVVSTDPEVVRFVLRAHAGGGERTLADTDLYARLAGLGEGQAVGLLDPVPLLSGLEQVVAPMGGAALLERIEQALTTAGPSVGMLRADDRGLMGRGLQLPRADGPDAALYALLTSQGAPSPVDVLSWTPEDALAASGAGADLAGWWAWLDDVTASAAELGVPTATEALQMVGLDVRTTLLSWVGDAWGQVQVGPPAAGAPGAADVPVLGEQVLLVASRDDAAARTGLQSLFTTLGATLAGFMSPSGQAMVAPQTVEVAGADVLRLPLSDTLVLDAAVLDGWVLLSGTPEATEAALAARASGTAGPAALREAAAELPAATRSWSLTNDRQAAGGSVEALVGQLQMLAGLGGASTLDFAAVDEASEAVTAYAAFLADRLGTSRSYATVEGGVIRSESRTFVAW
jgi:hypothetical protein